MSLSHIIKNTISHTIITKDLFSIIVERNFQINVGNLGVLGINCSERKREIARKQF